MSIKIKPNGLIDLNNNKIINSQNPIDNYDLSTKYYVDNYSGSGSNSNPWNISENTLKINYNVNTKQQKNFWVSINDNELTGPIKNRLTIGGSNENARCMGFDYNSNENDGNKMDIFGCWDGDLQTVNKIISIDGKNKTINFNNRKISGVRNSQGSDEAINEFQFLTKLSKNLLITGSPIVDLNIYGYRLTYDSVNDEYKFSTLTSTIPIQVLHGFPNISSKFLRGDGIWSDVIAIVGDNIILDTNINTNANIQRSKINSGNPNHVIINASNGYFSSEAFLAKSRGGFGADMSNKNGYTFFNLGNLEMHTTINRNKISSTTPNTIVYNDVNGNLGNIPIPLNIEYGGTGKIITNSDFGYLRYDAGIPTITESIAISSLSISQDTFQYQFQNGPINDPWTKEVKYLNEAIYSGNEERRFYTTFQDVSGDKIQIYGSLINVDSTPNLKSTVFSIRENLGGNQMNYIEAFSVPYDNTCIVRIGDSQSTRQAILMCQNLPYDTTIDQYNNAYITKSYADVRYVSIISLQKIEEKINKMENEMLLSKELGKIDYNEFIEKKLNNSNLLDGNENYYSIDEINHKIEETKKSIELNYEEQNSELKYQIDILKKENIHINEKYYNLNNKINECMLIINELQNKINNMSFEKL